MLKNRKKIPPKVKTEVLHEEVKVAAKKSSPIKLAIRAQENCWIQLHCDGKKIFEGILKKGMKESWNAKEKMKLSLGNAGGVEIELNDRILSPVGRKGQVVKDIIITSEGISIGKKRR